MPSHATIIVIGAGVVGSATAMALTKLEGVDVVVLEAEFDLAQGASKANSGIVHGGFDATPATLKAQLGGRGNAMFPALCEELSVPLNMCGSLVLSFSDRDDHALAKLKGNARANGVQVEHWDAARVLTDQPHVSGGVRGALFCASAGVVSPYMLTVAMCEAAAKNGARFLFGRRVRRVVRARDSNGWVVEAVNAATGESETYAAAKVVNAAGMGAHQVVAPFNWAQCLHIKPRRGEYILLSKQQGMLVTRVLFQAPTQEGGKGVLVVRTIDGNLLLGPSATDQEDRDFKGTTMQNLAFVAWAARRSVPRLDTREALRSFAGVRARSETGDFVIREQDGYVLLAGIDSPGLTAAPAIAERVVELLGLADTPKRSEWARRRPYASTDEPLSEGAQVGHADPACNIVCQCECVVEATVVDAIRAEPKPGSVEGVKWRTRCGMGKCQGTRCRPRVQRLLEREDTSKEPALRPSKGDRVGRAALSRL